MHAFAFAYMYLEFYYAYMYHATTLLNLCYTAAALLRQTNCCCAPAADKARQQCLCLAVYF